MSTITLEQFKAMFADVAAELAAKEKDLCALDSVCGDGDHGTAINGAIGAANQSIQGADNLKDGFFDAGFAAMSNSNGSTSTLFGSLLMGISEGIAAGATSMDASALSTAFDKGLESVRANTKADIGDKTLMDALIPAVNALKEKTSVREALDAAAQAAEQGAKNTEQLQARFGRAKNLGERSIGSIDAGATSISIIFAIFAKTYK